MSRAVQCISAHVALIGTTSALTYPLGSSAAAQPLARSSSLPVTASLGISIFRWPPVSLCTVAYEAV